MSPQPITRAIRAAVDSVDAKARRLVCRASTCALDRMATVIKADGIDYQEYLRNPVLCYEHCLDKRGSMPVGRTERLWHAIGPDGPELLAAVRFFDGARSDPFIDQLWECYRCGDMRAFSVRIIPHEKHTSPPTRSEIRDRPELADCVMMYRRSTLAELSAVTVPGNQDALTVEDARSLLRCVNRGLPLPSGLVSSARQVADRCSVGTEGLPPLGGRPAASSSAAAAIREAFRAATARC